MKRPLGALLALALLAVQALAGPSQVGGRTSPDKAESVTVDLPGGEQLKNVGGRDGAGLCVFTSVEHSGRWQNAAELRGFQQKMRSEPGGGWPEKLDRMMERYAPHVHYVQYTDGNPEVLKLALKTGRCPAVTYGYSPRYGGPVAHMVNLVHLSDRWAAVLDNNFPGDDKYEWMDPPEFLRRWRLNNGGWSVVVLNPGPPPMPVNALALAAGPVAFQVFGQRTWGPQGCPPVGGPRLVSQPDVYEWKGWDDGTKDLKLLWNGRYVGMWDATKRHYRPYRGYGKEFGPPCEPPVPLPKGVARKGDDCTGGCKCSKCDDGCQCPKTGLCSNGCRCVLGEVENFGVDLSKMAPYPSYTINGRKASAAEVRQAIEGGLLVDDSQKLRLTVCGTAEECRPVLDDLARHPALASYRDRLLVQAYRPEAWAVAGVNLPRQGSPVITLQAAPDSGGKAKCLHCQHDYDGGAEALAGALREADPGFDPAKVPDLRKKPQPPPPTEPDAKPGPKPDDSKPAPEPAQVPQWVTFLLALAVAVAFYAVIIWAARRQAARSA